MKKTFRAGLLLLILFSVCTLWAGEKRMLYVVRHGQAGEKGFRSPTQETILTPLGEEQAKCAGAYLKKIGFKGTVYASPIYRTMQTASFICDALDVKFIIEAGLQEHSLPKNPEDVQTIVPYGCSREQFAQYFPRAIIPEDYVYPWRVSKETEENRTIRMEKTLDKLLAKTKGNLLLVTHGGSMGALRRILAKRGGAPKGTIWNCALLVYELDENGKVISCRIDTEKYLTDMQMTNNFVGSKVPRPDDPRYKPAKQKKSKKKFQKQD